MSVVGSLTGRERSRWPPLTRMLMSGEISDEPIRELTPKQKFDQWMVNEGYRRVTVALFMLIQLMVFGFAVVNFTLKDNLNNARQTFGVTYQIARSAALILHVDVALILFRKPPQLRFKAARY
jgi:NADPH oxidase 2